MKDALQIYPQVASIPSHHGDLPLHICLYARKTWSTGIKEMFEAAPDSNLNQCHKTGLFPFMIAASKYNNDNGYNPDNTLITRQHKTELSFQKQVFLSELTTIYKLLQAAPFQVCSGILKM